MMAILFRGRWVKAIAAKFSYHMTALLSWLEVFVAIRSPVIELQQNNFPVAFELWAKMIGEMSLRSDFWLM